MLFTVASKSFFKALRKVFYSAPFSAPRQSLFTFLGSGCPHRPGDKFLRKFVAYFTKNLRPCYNIHSVVSYVVNAFAAIIIILLIDCSHTYFT